jgi:hypothetical protein
MGVTTLKPKPTRYRPVIGGVPNQFLDLARAMRARVMAANEDFSKAAVRVTRPLRERARRSPIPRQQLLIDARRLWGRVPSFGLLDRSMILERHSLQINELRISASDFRAEGWQANALEPGISIVGVVLNVAEHRFDFDVLSMVSVSQHALARWYQRSIITTDDELWDDLRSLAQAHAGLASGEVGAPFGVVVSSGAQWVGHTLEVSDPKHSGAVDTAAVVRTFK